jgi:hypothetical protein
MFICNCCGCHCKAFAFITKHDKPGLIAQSNYYASVDAFNDYVDIMGPKIYRCAIIITTDPILHSYIDSIGSRWSALTIRLFPDNFDQHAFAPPTVELTVKNLFPGAGIIDTRSVPFLSPPGIH